MRKELRRLLLRRRLMMGRGGGLSFLLRDDFTTAQAAPLSSPRNAEPGPGTLTLVQVDGEFSISSNKLNFPVQATPAYPDQGFYSDGLSRLAGRSIVCTVRLSTVHEVFPATWATSQTLSFGGFANVEAGVYTNTSSLYAVAKVSTGYAVSDALTIATDYKFAIVLRSVGAFIFIKGGAFAEWTLLSVSAEGATGTLYPAFENSRAVGTLDTFRVIDLASPYDTDWGIVSQRTASPTANATITSEANADIEFTWTAVTGETMELSVRRTDDNNRWIIRGDQAGSTVKLIKVEAGVESEAASAAQTWTNGTGYRLFIVQDGNTIKGHIANVLKWTYASASFNNTATGVKTNKAGTDLASWPRQLSGTAATLLDSAVA